MTGIREITIKWRVPLSHILLFKNQTKAAEKTTRRPSPLQTLWSSTPTLRSDLRKLQTVPNTNRPHFQTPFWKEAPPWYGNCVLCPIYLSGPSLLPGHAILVAKVMKYKSIFFKQMWNCFAEYKWKYSQWVVIITAFIFIMTGSKNLQTFQILLEKTKLGGDNQKKQILVYIGIAIQSSLFSDHWHMPLSPSSSLLLPLPLSSAILHTAPIP